MQVELADQKTEEEKIPRRREHLEPDATSMATARAAHIDYTEHPCSQPR